MGLSFHGLMAFVMTGARKDRPPSHILKGTDFCCGGVSLCSTTKSINVYLIILERRCHNYTIFFLNSTTWILKMSVFSSFF